jgi:hypothetical protein
MTSGTTRRFSWRIAGFAFAALSIGVLFAQEGHPLVGSWHGNWGPSAKDRTDITVIFNWDGTNLTGTLNPGLDAMKLQSATLQPGSWAVHFEADGKDRSGSKVRVVAEGKVQDITNVRRTIAGTWTQGTVKGDFKLTRDN